MHANNDHFVFKIGKPTNLTTLIIDNYFGQSPSQSSNMLLSDLIIDQSMDHSTEERKDIATTYLAPAVSPRSRPVSPNSQRKHHFASAFDGSLAKSR